MSTPERSVRLGVLATPGLPEDMTARIADDLAEDLREAYGSLGWHTELVVDRLAVPPAPTTELIDAARRALLAQGWDLAVVVTDMPMRLGGRPVARHVSRTHGVALVSLPALGPLHLKRRLRQVLSETAGELIGAANSLREIAADADDQTSGLRYVPAVILGHVRLLFGMVRANRPWRFTAKLYGVLVAALAAGAYGIVASDIWRISAALSWWRLAALCLVSLTVTIVAVIVAHELWERSPDPRARAQVLLFNVTTALTVTIGIARSTPRWSSSSLPVRRSSSQRQYSLKRWAATARRATTSRSPGSRRPSAPSPAHSAPHSSQTPPSGKPPTGQPARKRKSMREPDRTRPETGRIPQSSRRRLAPLDARDAVRIDVVLEVVALSPGIGADNRTSVRALADQRLQLTT